MLYNAAGDEVMRNRDTNRRDPLIDFTSLADGEYVVEIHDFLYGGGPEYFYRLSIGVGPYLLRLSAGWSRWRHRPVHALWTQFAWRPRQPRASPSMAARWRCSACRFHCPATKPRRTSPSVRLLRRGNAGRNPVPTNDAAGRVEPGSSRLCRGRRLLPSRNPTTIRPRHNWSSCRVNTWDSSIRVAIRIGSRSRPRRGSDFN